MLPLPTSRARAAAAPGRGQAADGLDQALPRGAAHLRPDHRDRPHQHHVAKQVVDFFAAKAIGVTTNVAGPLDRALPRRHPHHRHPRLGPRLGARRPSGVCIFSYDGVVRVGFKADAAVVTDPEKLVHAFDDEMDTLVRLAAAV